MMDCNLHERRCSWLVLQVLGILILMVILPTDAMIAKMPISQTSSSKLMYSHLKSNVSNTMTIGQTPFLPGKKPSIHRSHNVQVQVQVHFQKRIAWSQAHAKRDNTLTMLRNFDLPEAIIFYGMDTFVVPASITNKEKTLLQPGVERLLKEAQEIDTSVILLSESKTEVQIQEFLQQQPFYDSISAFNLQIRSSLDMLDPSKFLGRGMGHAPCPAALLDAISSVEIHPKGFGGSSGFGTKQADPERSPLPKHTVVFISGPSENSRARTSAARLAGMRTLYIETDGVGSCDADDLADAVVETLGTKDDWEMITLDSISTPGSFWLNPPMARDDDGNRVDTDDLITWFLEERTGRNNKSDNEIDSNGGGESEIMMEDAVSGSDELGEEDLESILADLDPL